MPEMVLAKPAGREPTLVEHSRGIGPLLEEGVLVVGFTLMVINVAVESHGRLLR